MRGAVEDDVSERGAVDVGDVEPGFGGEGDVVLDGAFATADEHEHAQVHLGERGRVVAGTAVRLDHDDPSLRPGRLGAATQDGQGLVVVPVVHHTSEHVRVAPGRQRVEETLADELTPLGQAALAQV